ncbi:putative glycerol-3-phosphate transporter 5 [Iris pallida]|uniref:Glycerol-3-phosphate transporter 5 n=1 Tax=Iris pallida TaxID=29817 RepID=A0AAX6DT72_IRIPA|nr:putative glycerol-3-phosphate transporter 5 [Iris pallida]
MTNKRKDSFHPTRPPLRDPDRVGSWLVSSLPPDERTTMVENVAAPAFHYRISALVLTFAAYASFHASRKPPSVAKSVLLSTFPPFSSPGGAHRLGELDLAFLLSYSLSMFVSGRLADRYSPRPLLLLSSLLSSLSLLLLSLAYFLPLHSLPFFLALNVAGGFFQSFAWPCVVSVVANWHGGSHSVGAIMGAWNSHTSFGNILGSVLAASVLDYGWGWSFALPAALLAAVGVVVFAFLVAHPSDVGLEVVAGAGGQGQEMGNADGGNGEEDAGVLGPDGDNGGNGEGVDAGVLGPDGGNGEGEAAGVLGPDGGNGEGEAAGLLGPDRGNGEETAIGFLEAWMLPGVAPYAFSLFFSKLVAYTFLYWLPFYIRHTDVAGKQLSHKMAGILSTIFDVGGVFGGASAGLMSDRLGARAVTSVIFLFLSIPALFCYRTYGSISMFLNICLMFLTGYFVNGPYSLISTAVAADLGTQGTNGGNSRALATVTAIIDGTGSAGAALGPLLTGYISTRSWNGVFVMLIVSNSLAILVLIRLAIAEVIRMLNPGE